MKSFEENSEYKNCVFYFIIGSDLVGSLTYWDDGPNLLEEINFLIFCRQGYSISSEILPKSYTVIQTVLMDVSSTEARQRIEKNSSMYKSSSILVNNTRNSNEYKDFQAKLSESKAIITSKYLGILGLVPKSVINYINENKLYYDKIWNYSLVFYILCYENNLFHIVIFSS